MIFSASSRLVLSGTVGPDATKAGLSPGISETTSEKTFAGWAQAANLPPLMVERCFLTAFIAEIGAPDASNDLLTAISSSKVRPSGGDGNNAEPPPEMSATTRSSSVRPDTASNSRFEAASPASSGIGCDASMISIVLQGVP